MKRVLVTTALEETWPTDGAPILFLGEWCKLFDRRYVWKELDYAVAPYHWDDRNKLCQDYHNIQNLYEEVLQTLAVMLNELHGVNHSLRYWQILVGPWLGYFIQTIFDRWFMLKAVLETQEIDSIRVIKRNAGDGVPNDMADFNALFVGDDWNEIIYGQILSFLSVPVDKVESASTTGEMRAGVNRVSETGRTHLKRQLASIAARTSGLLTRSEEYFFIASYLGIKQDFLLQMKLGQLPKLWRSPALPRFEYAETDRQWILSMPISETPETWVGFRALIGSLVPGHIPTAYLEGYPTLVKMANDSSWPQSPKMIFTSNSYSSDDLFKAWAAAKVEQGTPMVVGQHGGNYGMALWNFSEDHQIAISDRFLTWGWKDAAQKKLVSIGNLKGFARGKITREKANRALLVEMAIPRYSYHMYSVPVGAGQWGEYLEDQYRFVNALPEKLRSNLLIRLYANDYGHGQTSRWRSCFPDIELDSGARPMAELIKQARLYISSYNATTYLESLSQNLPTLIFWNPGHWELREGVQPYFELLAEAGIFHETPEGAARQMAKVWDNIDVWWYDSRTQKAREVFCESYAHIPKKPLEILARLFRDISSEANQNRLFFS